jgi:hypothetical protein
LAALSQWNLERSELIRSRLQGQYGQIIRDPRGLENAVEVKGEKKEACGHLGFQQK